MRFIRQPNRVIGALATPLVFWLLIGAGMGHSFKASADSSENYLTYFYPGTVLMILLFTAIFSTISIIEDRREGFLQSVLVAPISRFAIVLGKSLGGTALASGQGMIFLLLAPFIGIHFTLFSALLAAGIIIVISFALTALGICIAWRMSSTQGFHAIMNLFLMPMWFLSGALFPAANAFVALRIVMQLNPLTYGLAALRRALNWTNPTQISVPTLPLSLSVLTIFAIVMFSIATMISRQRISSDLQ